MYSNAVLEHLEHPYRTMCEVARVLRPGGVLVINTCLRRQIEAGYWFMALIPEVRERLARRHPDEVGAAIRRALKSSGSSVRPSPRLQYCQTPLPPRR